MYTLPLQCLGRPEVWKVFVRRQFDVCSALFHICSFSGCLCECVLCVVCVSVSCVMGVYTLRKLDVQELWIPALLSWLFPEMPLWYSRFSQHPYYLLLFLGLSSSYSTTNSVFSLGRHTRLSPGCSARSGESHWLCVNLQGGNGGWWVQLFQTGSCWSLFGLTVRCQLHTHWVVRENWQWKTCTRTSNRIGPKSIETYYVLW